LNVFAFRLPRLGCYKADKTAAAKTTTIENQGMGEEQNRQAKRAVGGGLALLVLLLASGCSSSSLSTNIFGTSNIFGSSRTPSGAGAEANANVITDNSVDCPSVSIRNGASTLMIADKSTGESEPAPLDVRYQGSIIRTARECHVNSGLMTMKVGIEGRVITGPAGGPGTVNVPIRIAVVQEGINPRTIVSKFGQEQVVVNNAVDRVTFTHIDSDISFPLPVPISALDSYVVYIGFDPLGAQPPKVRQKPKARHRAKPAAIPKPGAQPGQS
jgi:hypothetical protein